jgi:SPP1 gp7 family putative phage head morphogenesis protein
MLRLRAHLDALTGEIARARAEGQLVRESWLFSQQRYQQLIIDHQEEVARFLDRAATPIARGQRDALGLAARDAPRLTLAALGPGPRDAAAQVTASFNRMSGAQFEAMVGRASNGTPLRELLVRAAPGAAETLRDVLASGVARGAPVRVIAREARNAARLPAFRALTIARTEVLGAYRASTHERYRQSEFVRTWTWTAELSDRTCSSCWSMHGTVHPDTETLDAHVRCRCIQIPNTPSWSEMGYSGVRDSRPSVPDRDAAFRSMEASSQRKVLGATRHDAWQQGDLALDDLARFSVHPTWGRSVRAATLDELGL